MKRLSFIFIALAAVIGCSKESSKGTIQPEEVTVSLDYSFVESGGLTKTGSQVYDDFYENYIKTKVLTPKTFSLTFTNKETGAVASIRGDWDKKHSFKLLTGEYEVTGTSHPAASKCLDSLYLCFNENITINSETQSINLTALHDSYMLMFDKSDKNSVSYSYQTNAYPTESSSIEFSVQDDTYYAFFNEFYGYTSGNRIYIRRDSGTSSITMDNIPFEKGKYYYFNDISNSFDIPPMESGN